MELQQALDNMRGGCAYNFDGSNREPSTKTDIQYNIQRWVEKYGQNPSQDVIEYWNK